VKVVWTREDDIRGGYYRPAFVHRVQVALDAKGNPSAWDHVIVDIHPRGYAARAAWREKWDRPNVRRRSCRVSLSRKRERQAHHAPHHQNTHHRPLVALRRKHAHRLCDREHDRRARARDESAIRRISTRAARAKTALLLPRSSSPRRRRGGKRLRQRAARGPRRARIVRQHRSGGRGGLGGARTHQGPRGHLRGGLRLRGEPARGRSADQSAVVFGLTAALYGKLTVKDGRCKRATSTIIRRSGCSRCRRSASTSFKAEPRWAARRACDRAHRASRGECGVRAHPERLRALSSPPRMSAIMKRLILPLFAASLLACGDSQSPVAAPGKGAPRGSLHSKSCARCFNIRAVRMPSRRRRASSRRRRPPARAERSSRQRRSRRPR